MKTTILICILSLLTCDSLFAQRNLFSIKLDSAYNPDRNSREYALILSQSNSSAEDIYMLKNWVNNSYVHIYQLLDNQEKEIQYPNDFPFPKIEKLDDSTRTILSLFCKKMDQSILRQRFAQNQSKSKIEATFETDLKNISLSRVDSISKVMKFITQTYGKNVYPCLIKKDNQNDFSEFLDISFLSKGMYKATIELPDYDISKVPQKYREKITLISNKEVVIQPFFFRIE